MPLIFLLFILVPITEMFVLINVGGHIGALNTVGLVLLTAVIGATMLRQQGLQTLTRAQHRMNSGELPAQEMLEGLALAFGGALLLTPGFITDAVGFLCLIPASRAAIARSLMRRGVVQGFAGVSGVGGSKSAGPFADQGFSQQAEHREYRERPGSSAGPSGRTQAPPVQEDADGHLTIEGDFRRED